MKEIREIVHLAKQFILSKKRGRPAHEVELFIAEMLGLASRLDLYLYYDKPIGESELALLRPGIKRLAAGEPLAYILNRADFYGSQFYVTPDVLIPRPETELLVEKALESIAVLQNSRPDQKIRVLDLCCGSGCIGISLKKKVPEIDISLIDISDQALLIAKKNSEIHQVELSLIKSDLLSNVPESIYDIIVSNPPYLSEEEMKELDSSVAEFEPSLALFGGVSGIELYEKIAKDLHRSLSASGFFLCEIGFRQGKDLFELLHRYHLSEIKIYQDYQERDRVVVCRNNSLCKTTRFNA